METHAVAIRMRTARVLPVFLIRLCRYFQVLITHSLAIDRGKGMYDGSQVFNLIHVVHSGLYMR